MNVATSSRADSLEIADRTFAPVIAKERISSVDTLRGFALLGILLMNIEGFALPWNGYADLTSAGGDTGMNLAVWAVNYILVEGKMRATFSMLFGAGVILLTSRGEERGAGAAVADIFYRRTLWLIAFGMAHAYLIWQGDILYGYGVAGLFLYPLRKLSPKRLILIGVLVLAVLGAKDIKESLNDRSLRDRAAVADAAAAAGKTLTDEQRDDQKEWAEKLKDWKPPATEIAKEIAVHQAGYWKLFLWRAKRVVRVESLWFYRWGFFDVVGMMLLGMALLKLGVFSAKRSFREYALMALVGYSIGVSVNVYVAWQTVRDNFGPQWMLFDWTPYGLLNWGGYNFERLAVALAHVAVLMMFIKAGFFRWMTSRLAAVGQMALSNYLMHSIICTTIFNGFGFGLFGKLQRFEIYGVVLAIWAFQLMTSRIWLDHFRFGPVEWVWRSLTYGRRQPMRMLVPAPALQPVS